MVDIFGGYSPATAREFYSNIIEGSLEYFKTKRTINYPKISGIMRAEAEKRIDSAEEFFELYEPQMLNYFFTHLRGIYFFGSLTSNETFSYENLFFNRAKPESDIDIEFFVGEKYFMHNRQELHSASSILSRFISLVSQRSVDLHMSPIDSNGNVVLDTFQDELFRGQMDDIILDYISKGMCLYGKLDLESNLSNTDVGALTVACLCKDVRTLNVDKMFKHTYSAAWYQFGEELLPWKEEKTSTQNKFYFSLFNMLKVWYFARHNCDNALNSLNKKTEECKIHVSTDFNLERMLNAFGREINLIGEFATQPRSLLKMMDEKTEFSKSLLDHAGIKTTETKLKSANTILQTIKSLIDYEDENVFSNYTKALSHYLGGDIESDIRRTISSAKIPPKMKELELKTIKQFEEFLI